MVILTMMVALAMTMRTNNDNVVKNHVNDHDHDHDYACHHAVNHEHDHGQNYDDVHNYGNGVVRFLFVVCVVVCVCVYVCANQAEVVALDIYAESMRNGLLA